MTRVFADSFYWFALANPRDQAHAKAVAYSQRKGVRLVTTAWVLTELADGFSQSASRPTFLRLLGLIRSDPLATVVPADQPLMDRDLALYAARPVLARSLTDCISFVVMADAGLTDALTADHHFTQAGFTALLG